MKGSILVFLGAALLSPGCAFMKSINPFEGTPALSDTQYVGYVAINPIALPSATFKKQAKKESVEHDPNLDSLSNNAARVSLQEIAQSGEVKYVASAASAQGSYYKATIDYIKYYSFGTTIDVKKAKLPGATGTEVQQIPIGVAVGVGLRAEATFFATEGKANISDIVNIGVSAQSKKISGTLSFQTMGIESKAITDTLPIPSELSTSSIQGALQAIVTVKANIYGKDTRVVPQIVGIEILTHGDGVTVNDIIVALHENRAAIADKVGTELEKMGITFVAEPAAE